MMSWIHLTDLVSLIRTSLGSQDYEGPINAVSPNPLPNAEFTKVLAQALNRPAPFPVPGPALRLALGGVSSVLLGVKTRFPRAPSRLGFSSNSS